MEPIKRLFKELGAEVYKFIILESLLNAGIFFFLTFMISALLKINVFIPVILSFIFLGWNISHKGKSFQLKRIEESNPEVKEILRTARDNIGNENLLTMALFNELIEKMKNVSIGNLISEKKVIVKLCIAGILAFLSVSFTTMNLWDINLDVDLNLFKPRPPMAIAPIQLNETNDIYGDLKVAKLGNEMLTIQITPTLSDVDFSKVSEAEKRDLNLNSFPGDIEAQADKISGEERPKEFKLAKEYNLKLHEIIG